MNSRKQLIDSLLNELTLDEKIDMVHGTGAFHTGGIDRLQIPPLVMSDGPMGVRKQFTDKTWIPCGKEDDYVTYLISNTALASTWSKEASYKAGEVLGAEARGRGKDVILAPGINVQRYPLCGRNFEYMSEDTCLISEMVVPFVKGVQTQDVAACVKHFALNAQEYCRMDVKTFCSKRALYEMYLPHFYASIKEGNAYSIMGAYNKFNEEQCCESKALLKDILRDEWNYDGVVISDWGGIHHTENAYHATMDIDMSVSQDFDNYYYANPLKEKIQNGELSVDNLNESVRRILEMMYELKMIGQQKEERKAGHFNSHESQQAVLSAGQEAIVLLKNDEKHLPLNKKNLKKVAVIGQNAIRKHSNGGGSAEVKALYEITPLLGLKMRLGGNTEILFGEGHDLPTDTESYRAQNEVASWQTSSVDIYEMRIQRFIKSKTSGIIDDDFVAWNDEKANEALQMARECEEVIFFAGIDHDIESEGIDRLSLKLPYNQDRLLNEIVKVNQNVTVVVLSGSPVVLGEWKNHVKSILWHSYLGSEGGLAVADVILGNVNPSGKLPMTFPLAEKDHPSVEMGEYKWDENELYFREDIFVGYRYFDKKNKEVLYPFGYGLSYTKFEYSDLQINDRGENVDILLTVKNTGDMDGADVVQIYSELVEVDEAFKELPYCVRELKAFDKLFLKKGESKHITMTVDKKQTFRFFDEEAHAYRLLSGQYRISAGHSSRELVCSAMIEIGSDQ